jgi:hypothetical protein
MGAHAKEVGTVGKHPTASNMDLIGIRVYSLGFLSYCAMYLIYIRKVKQAPAQPCSWHCLNVEGARLLLVTLPYLGLNAQVPQIRVSPHSDTCVVTQ